MQDFKKKIMKYEDHQQKINLLVFGYCCQFQKSNHKKLIPDDIIRLVVNFSPPPKIKVYYQRQASLALKVNLYFKDLTKDDALFSKIQYNLQEKNYQMKDIKNMGNIKDITNSGAIGDFKLLAQQLVGKVGYSHCDMIEVNLLETIKQLLEVDCTVTEMPEGMVNGNPLKYIKEQEAMEIGNSTNSSDAFIEETSRSVSLSPSIS